MTIAFISTGVPLTLWATVNSVVKWKNNMIAVYTWY